MSDRSQSMAAPSRFTRRVFVCGSAAALAALHAAPAGSLEQTFATPPDPSRPWVFWWWLNGSVTREGITRDLEEMQRQGIHGVLLFHAGGGPRVAPGPKFLSPEWAQLFQFALSETARLGMQMSFNLCDGWDSGGTWIEPEQANKKLVYSEIQVDGPAAVDRTLPVPPVLGDYYHDVAVVAFRERTPRAVQPADVRVSSSVPGYCKELNWHPLDIVDGDPNTFWRADPRKSGKQWVEWHYHEPLAATSILLAPTPLGGPRDCELQVPAPDGTFRTITTFAIDQGRAARIEFPETRASVFRLVIHSAWQPDIQLAQGWLLRKGDQPPARPGIRWWWFKSGNRSFWDYPKHGPRALEEEYPEDGIADLDTAEVIDLTPRTTAGRLNWNAPAGRWTILRFGYTLQGQKTRASSTNNDGWEADMLDSRGIEKQFQSVAVPVLDLAGSHVGRTLVSLHVDSYELGADVQGQQPTWSIDFREEFRRRRGYDLLPWLPTLARRIANSRDDTNRFFWDIRRTIGDLFAERFFGRFAELAHARGVAIDCETGYGTYPHPHIDGLQCAGKCDVTMGEFWYGTDIMSQFDGFCNVIRSVASAAHIYGKKVIQAESFTAWTHFQEYPAALKPVGDLAFADGLTRMVVHQYTHQPAIGPQPGIQYGAGTHLDRNVTWWPQSGPFLTYLARCQSLLEAGHFHADLAYFYGEGATTFVPGREHMRPELPHGYDCDFWNAEVLLSATVRDGYLLLPSGMRYRLLVLPERPRLSPALLTKLRDLIEAGASVSGAKPTRPPGLGGDAEAARLATLLWGATPEASGERTIGRGRLFWGQPLDDVLETLGLPPDVDIRQRDGDGRFRFLHRTTPEGELYFLSNQLPREEPVECIFRVTGRQPELWNPVTGERRLLPEWRSEGAATLVPLHFEPHQSWFVLFRRAASRHPAGRNVSRFQEQTELTGPWSVGFDPAWGGPKQVEFSSLEDWTQRPEEGIRYYSGKATYRRRFNLPPVPAGQTLWLHLGTVNHIAQVRVNGVDLGIVWCAPWRVRLPAGLPRDGNELEIDVVNLWVNRLVGDARLPAPQRLTRTNLNTKPDTPLVPSGLLGPVRVLSES